VRRNRAQLKQIDSQFLFLFFRKQYRRVEFEMYQRSTEKSSTCTLCMSIVLAQGALGSFIHQLVTPFELCADTEQMIGNIG
jgi:hypothetical protein